MIRGLGLIYKMRVGLATLMITHTRDTSSKLFFITFLHLFMFRPSTVDVGGKTIWVACITKQEQTTSDNTASHAAV